jgi:hypothetical protein
VARGALAILTVNKRRIKLRMIEEIIHYLMRHLTTEELFDNCEEECLRMKSF